MHTLILKLNATGDVVRTTPLLHRIEGDVTWITAERNLPLLDGLNAPAGTLRALTWENRSAAADARYDLVINLEDEREQAEFASTVSSGKVFGAYLTESGEVGYTKDASGWFDMSLISIHGRRQADQLKLRNRRTYQDLIFEALGFRFQDEPYLLPAPAPTGLEGDVAIAPVAGPVWPSKNWSGYDELKSRLEANGLTVNVLPKRATLLEHLGDIAGHRCLVGGDSLPMHLALGLGVPCVSIFTCTSPWEIHDYDIQTKIISPLLEKYFYHRGYSEEAVSAVSVDEVLDAVRERISGAVAAVLPS